MKRAIAIYLLLVCSLAAADRVALVGGTSSAATNAAWFDPDQVAVADSHDGNGGPADSGTNAGTSDNGSDKVRITSVDAFANAEVGMFMFADFDATYTDGRYEITAVGNFAGGATNDFVDLDLADIGDATENVSVWAVGGAVPNTYNVAAYDLEDVLDDTIGNAASQDVEVLIHTPSDVDPTETIQVDSNGGAGAFFKRIIGTDSAYAPLTVGNYATYDLGVTGLGDGDPAFNISVDNVKVENIAALNPDGSSGTPAGSEDCFTISGDKVVFINCRARRGRLNFAFTATAASGALINCYGLDPQFRNVSQMGLGGYILGGLYDWGTAFTDDRNIAAVATTTMENVVISGGTYGFSGAVAESTHIAWKCSFVGQSVAGFHVNFADILGIAINCIFDVDVVGSDFAISREAGSIVEFNNITDAEAAVSGFQADSGSVSDLTFTNTDPWVSITGGNYSINLGQPVATTYVIDQGFVPFFGPDTPETNKSTLGAWDESQIVPDDRRGRYNGR